MYVKRGCSVRKTKQEAEITRQKIMDAALSLFRSRGYDATRLQDIAKATGMTRGAIYWHFKNKLDILLNLTLDMKRRFDQRVRNFQEENGSAIEKLKRLIQGIITAHTEDERLQDLVIVMMSNYEVSMDLKKEHFKDELPEQLIDIVRELAQQGIEEGTLRDDIESIDIAWLILFLFMGSTIANLKFPHAYEVSDKSERIVDCFMHGILKQGIRT
jgi:TetR/AcrR family acrAB operon transcriptional repressor